MKKDTILKSTTLEKELDVVMTQKQSLELANVKIDVDKTSYAVRTNVQELVKLRAQLASARQRRRKKQEASLGEIAQTKKRFYIIKYVFYECIANIMVTFPASLCISRCPSLYLCVVSLLIRIPFAEHVKTCH